MGWRELIRMKKRFGLMGLVTTLIIVLILMITGLADGLAYDNGAVIRNLPVEHMALSQEAEGQLTRSFLEEQEHHAGRKHSASKTWSSRKKMGRRTM